MGNSLSSLGLGSRSDSLFECCNGVVDPITLFSVLGAIVGVTIWLRQQIIDNVSVGRKKKRSITGLPRPNNLLQSDVSQSLQNKLQSLLVLLPPSLADEYNFYNVIITGRQIIMYLLCMETCYTFIHSYMV